MLDLIRQGPEASDPRGQRGQGLPRPGDTALKNDPTATVVVVGESTGTEKAPPKGKHAKGPEDFAAERAVNTKDYLVNEEQSGIDASRITVRTGAGDSKSVEDYLVPAGANFDSDVPGTTSVDASGVKVLSRKPIGEVEPKKVHKKKGAKHRPGSRIQGSEPIRRVSHDLWKAWRKKAR